MNHGESPTEENGTIEGCHLTKHAKVRMQQRGLSPEGISKVLRYGRVAYIRGARIYAIGRKEIDQLATHGVDLQLLDGAHVVCTHCGVVVTCYRNRSLRGLKPIKRRRRRCFKARTNRVSHSSFAA